MKKDPLLKIFATDKPHTFLIDFDWSLHYRLLTSHTYSTSLILYHQLAEEFVEGICKQGMKGKLKQRYTNNSIYYITFASKHDAMAFKLTWL